MLSVVIALCSSTQASESKICSRWKAHFQHAKNSQFPQICRDMRTHMCGFISLLQGPFQLNQNTSRNPRIYFFSPLDTLKSNIHLHLEHYALPYVQNPQCKKQRAAQWELSELAAAAPSAIFQQ